MPPRILQEKYLEEMIFPTLFYGANCQNHIIRKFTYKKIAPWETLHND